MLSSKSLMVLCFICRSVIHFELIFVKGVRSVSRSIFACRCPIFPALFVGKNIFAPLYCLCSFVKDQGLFLGPLFCSTDLYVYSFTNTTLS